METYQGNVLNPGAALAEITRLDRRMRGKARWHAWVWLITGAATAFAYVSQVAFTDDLGDFIAYAYGGLTVILSFYAYRQRVIDRNAAQVERRMAWAFVALCALMVLLELTVVPEGWSFWVILVGLLPAIPCVVIAWKVLRG